MPASRKYGDFYEDGSAARKLKPQYKEPIKKVTSKNKRANQSRKIQAINKKNNMSTVAFILVGFSMAMIVSYRFSLIDEKNLKTQELRKELEQVSSSLASIQMEVEQNTDLNKIEAYAKQQLGMQKPGKDQTVYVDTSEASRVVNSKTDTTILESVTNFIISVINDIF